MSEGRILGGAGRLSRVPQTKSTFPRASGSLSPLSPDVKARGPSGRRLNRGPPPAPGVMAGGAEGGGSWVKEDWSWGGEQGGAVGVSWWVSLELGLGWSGG